MNSMNFGAALVDTMDVMKAQLDGAITTGITPEPAEASMPATSTLSTGTKPSRGFFLLRALRFPAKIGARSDLLRSFIKGVPLFLHLK